MSEPEPPRAVITLMTWNVFVGAEVEAVLDEEDPGRIPVRVAEAWAAVRATDFPERAGAIADEIAVTRPHLVGLQEISRFRRTAPRAELDFLEVLLDTLRSAGLDYRVAASVTNFDLTARIATGPTGRARIRLTDHDVILARGDVGASNPRAGRYAAHRTVTLAGREVAILRGWVSVDVGLAGRPWRVVNTHLEPADDGGTLLPARVPIQAGQAEELLCLLDGFDGPVILMGDLNSAADGSTTDSYARFLSAGFVDLWAVADPAGDGFTSNQAPHLANPESSLFHRIDHVLYRDGTRRGDGGFRGAVDAWLVGADPGRRTASGLWPSDHAGVVATIRPELP